MIYSFYCYDISFSYKLETLIPLMYKDELFCRIQQLC